MNFVNVPYVWKARRTAEASQTDDPKVPCEAALPPSGGFPHRPSLAFSTSIVPTGRPPPTI